MPPGGRKVGLAIVVLAALGLGPGQATAATTTVGQMAPNPYTTEAGPPPYYYPTYHYMPPEALCTSAQDLIGTGSTYTVPAYGTTITAWRTNAAGGSGQSMTLKVFRKVSEPATYEVVGHDGPRSLVPGVSNGGTVNSFTGLSIPVQPGDLIGLYPESAATAHDACMFPSAGAFLLSETNLADAQSTSFTSGSGRRLNLTADVTVTPPGGSPPQHTLTVNRGGSGYGSIQSSPVGIEACSALCSHAFDEGTVVTLTASPDGYSTFGGWEGGGCSGTGACQVALGADTSVTASFAPAGGAYNYDYGPGGSGSQAAGGATGTAGSVAQTKCRKGAPHSASRRAGRARCTAKTKLVAKERTVASLGMRVLTTKKGRTLYSLSAEHGTSFICTAGCLSVWHPLTVPAGVLPTGPVKLGTVTRPEGGVQVTYHGRPLYTFGEDSAPGEANGEGLKDVGTWGAVAVPQHRH